MLIISDKLNMNMIRDSIEKFLEKNRISKCTIIIAAAILFLITTIYLQVVANKKLQLEKRETAQIMFGIVENEFDQVIERAEDDLSTWALEIEEDSYETGCESSYTNVLDTNDNILNYGVIDKEGYSICARIDLGEDFNFNDEVEVYPQFVEDEQFTITNFGYSQSTGMPRIGFGHPLFDSEDNFNGAVFSSLSLISINEHIKEIGLPEDSELLVTDPKGYIQIIHPSDNTLIGEQKFSAKTFSIILANQEGSLTQKNEDGVDMLYIYKPYKYSNCNTYTSFIIYGAEYPRLLF